MSEAAALEQPAAAGLGVAGKASFPLGACLWP